MSPVITWAPVPMSIARRGSNVELITAGARGVEPVPDVDVDLQLAQPVQPGFVRRPDLVVVTGTALERVRRDGGLLRAGDVVLAVEITSPGSRRLDSVVKHREYSDARIRHYWILDLDGRVRVTACHLADGFGYQDATATTGRFATEQPFRVRLDLDRLV